MGNNRYPQEKKLKKTNTSKSARKISKPSQKNLEKKGAAVRPVESAVPVTEEQKFPQPSQRTFNENNPYYYVLNQVIDPEAGIGIVDMGLIYDVTKKDGIVQVTMTLTSMGCPAGPQLTTDVDGVLRLQKGVKEVEIQVVWEPAWTPDMMNPEIRAMMFGGF